jgi:competence protein ComEA
MNHRVAVVIAVLIVVAASAAVAGDTGPTGVVNVNTAGAEQLQLLPRIGPALAERIIEFRDANGPFASVGELVAVKGIGERSLERLEPYVTTDGATTLTAKVSVPRSSASGSSTDR